MYETRVNYNSQSNLKDRAFARRLEKDYNKERIARIEDMSTTYPAIIQTSQLNARYDYKKISLPFSMNIKIGDIIYWERTKSNWMIYLQRTTEKNYFLGEMREANYDIWWKDKFGKEYHQIGCFARTSPGSHGVIGSRGIKTDYVLDYLVDNAQLMLPKNDISVKLKLYDKFIIDGNVWEVRGVDSATYTNILLYTLKLAQWNKDEDTENLPHGKENIVSEIDTLLDNFSEVKLNSEIILDCRTKINGSLVEDKYEIKTKNCTLKDNTAIIFDNVGEAIVEIISGNTEKNKIYTISVLEQPSEVNTFLIQGPNTVKTTLSYKYKVFQNTNGETDKNITGYWSLNEKFAKIIESNQNECVIQIKNNISPFDLEYNVNGKVIKKTITITSLLDI